LIPKSKMNNCGANPAVSTKFSVIWLLRYFWLPLLSEQQVLFSIQSDNFLLTINITLFCY
jgi:hypothetical protein